MACPGTKIVEERHDHHPLSKAQMATPAWLVLMPVWDKILRPLTEGGESSVECVSVSTSISTFSSLIINFAVAIFDELEGPVLPQEFHVLILKHCFFNGTDGA